jgi:hypothetical protein
MTLIVTPLFSDFLENEREYRAAENYWEQLQHDIVVSLGAVDDWRRWQPLHAGDGTLMTPGNPIWDARSDALDRAIRIIQEAPTRMDAPEITAWITSRDEQNYPGSDFPRAELVVGLALSEESAVIARELLQRWMNGATTIEEMRALIYERLGVEGY